MGYLDLVRQHEEDVMAVRALRTGEKSAPLLETQVWTVTPDLAGDWLAKSGTNRTLSAAVVQRYASAISAGEWQATGEAIKFSKNGRLIDGQHRLAAVIMADKPIDVLVVTGLEDVAFDVLDSGRPRSSSDILHIHGYKNATFLAAASVKVLLFNRLGTFNHASDDYYPSKPEVLRFVQENPRIIDVCRIIIAGGPRFLGTSPAMIGALYYLFEQVDDVDCAAFFDKLRTGANLAEDDPIFQLRKRLVENAASTSRLHHHVLSAMFIKAWNYWREGRTIKFLVFRPGGQSPEPYPVIQ